ncbi:MAG: LysR family transcriptional regulator [Hydrogeniiclostridium mannosilyticum]
MATDLELYRIFSAVAEAGSFSQGAARLFITQPAVSQAVRRLEAQLGVRLFVRGRRGAVLTAEGELLYQHASAAMRLLASGEQKLRRVQNLEAGQLKLGAADTTTKELLLPYISAFHQLHPGVQLMVTNRTSLQLVECLKAGQLDLAIVNLPIEDEALSTRSIRTVHDIFVAGHAFPQLKQKTVTPGELAGYPLIMLENAANSRRYVDRFCRARVALAPEIELGAHELLSSFAAIGFGLACVVQEFCQKALKEETFSCGSVSGDSAPRHWRLLVAECAAERGGSGAAAAAGGEQTGLISGC